MSLTKKDPTLRVAANDPHLVSLGGGRLSTAVTIHYIPIGDMTIGSASTCSISLNGSGVRPIHCTIYRSEENEVTIVPEHDARILIDGTKITQETNLTQGAMITIGNSNYLRFNNPAEAQMMRSAMGSNERISMPQIDFTQVSRRDSTKSLSSSNGSADARQSLAIDSFYEEHISPMSNVQMSMSMGRESMKNILGSNKSLYNNVAAAPIDINGLHCPKVFTADLVTVNMPAKDVLGQKYANFAKNLAENHRADKNVTPLRNNQLNNIIKGNAQNVPGNYVNIPSTSNFIQNTNTNGGGEFLAKVNNTTLLRSASSANHHNVPAYDRYPKPGTYGGLQIYPMNGVNTEINSSSTNSSPLHRSQYESSPSMQRRNLSNLSNSENERLEDMLKICTEYSDRQNQSCAASLTSSPIVQNRIKTNGSLPRDKKSPFYHDLSGTQLQQSFSGSNSNLSVKAHNGPVSSSSGYENVRLVGQNRVEIGGQSQGPSSPKTGYENVVMGKYVPQSPRTKIRTTCMSPKKEHSFVSVYGQAPISAVPPPIAPKPSKHSEYEQLIKTFEEKLKLEMQAIEESSRYQPTSAAAKTAPSSAEHSPAKRANKNINNLTLNLYESNSLQNSPKLQKKPAPAPRMFSKTALMSFNNSGAAKNVVIAGSGASLQKTSASARSEVEASKTKQILADTEDIEQLKQTRKQLVVRVQELKNEISELQKQEAEELRELDMEKALVTAEVNSVGDSVGELETQLELLQNKIHRFEAQRNATRVMEENQQAKLKQSIEMKQDQVKKLKSMLQQKPSNDCLKEELHNVSESLENDRKTFEDLEFQYLEEESEWHAYREELHNEEANLSAKIKEKRIELQHLERQDWGNTSVHAKTLKSKLVAACNALKIEQEHLKAVESSICDITGELKVDSSDEDISTASSASPILHNNLAAGVMSQSLFGSAELLCPKRSSDDIMSKSVNENMFFNNKIELPAQAPVTSTPKRKQLYVVDIDDANLSFNHVDAAPSSEGGKHGTQNNEQNAERVKFNLTLGNDDFEVNPLERRVPSQDDIDRICKVTSSAPISTKGASTRIFDSIKEIERNRQLLLAQQGHHVIEHERQKIIDLKKKCHDEARAQYLLKMNNGEIDNNDSNSPSNANQSEMRELQRLESGEATVCLTKDSKRDANSLQKRNSSIGNGKVLCAQSSAVESVNNMPMDKPSQQRHSQPEFVDTQVRHSRSSPRPLSEANSELSCDLLDNDHKGTCKSNFELSTASANAAATGNLICSSERVASADEVANKRSSINSNETTSGGSASGSGSGSAQGERKRALPKHQRPLTRYLPIFSPDLNLRHHIESAGHQIALCPHVFVDAFSCRGYLHKLGATFHGWARRWFVLDRQRSAFIYYADKSERKPRGGAYFSTIDEVYLDHLNASKSGRPHCTFIVKTKKRSYHLQAASDAAARIWIDAIITGAQGNLDY
ncbi:pleckstrin homology-like domain family B member 1 isoform X1 [Anastrepha ludens]|uniref:pleckstrin homology-like domain family B member 1 isoform X1 n=1 Tax=Anastrepha ludens TaxID=28586 RepID=UPI0023B01720|nr:pleckstrin homology-like domain family B member 1 isoform X1 [Anastrepha ludens]XP_053948300.1 pleckstrin homology-like domain family B member 1 isoform X1 [Anastrepha ludens]